MGKVTPASFEKQKTEMKSCLERITDIRKKAGMSQKDMAKLLGLSQKVCSDYERGNIRIPLGCVIQLAEYFGFSMDYMCGLTDTPRPFPKRKAEGGQINA